MATLSTLPGTQRPAPPPSSSALLVHFTVFVLAQAMLVMWWAIMAVSGVGWFPWPIIPAILWGIVLAIHAVVTFRRSGR